MTCLFEPSRNEYVYSEVFDLEPTSGLFRRAYGSGLRIGDCGLRIVSSDQLNSPEGWLSCRAKS
jgi:hypothetical protein